MANAQKYIRIRDKEILVKVRNYKNTNKVAMYFKGNILNISKPANLNTSEIIKLIKENENQIYDQYIKIISTENKNIKHWKNGEKILYKGEEYTIVREQIQEDWVRIVIEKEKKQIKVKMPVELKNEDEIKEIVDKAIKKLFQNNAGVIIQERLPYWSKKTGIGYKTFKIRDAISRFGSCVPKQEALHFSSRLVMLPQDKIDAIIVHELCHMIHKNHSKEFYNLVKQYIPNYDEIDKWLKENGKLILI